MFGGRGGPGVVDEVVAGAHVADVARGHEAVAIVPGAGEGRVWAGRAGVAGGVGGEGGRRGGGRARAAAAGRVELGGAEAFAKGRVFEAGHGWAGQTATRT